MRQKDKMIDDESNRLISHFHSLEEINFGDCLLKTKGAVILGEALQDEHLALETLILDHNEIGANGGYAIAAAMHNKEQLQTLNLNGNQVRSSALITCKQHTEHRIKIYLLPMMIRIILNWNKLYYFMIERW